MVCLAVQAAQVVAQTEWRALGALQQGVGALRRELGPAFKAVARGIPKAVLQYPAGYTRAAAKPMRPIGRGPPAAHPPRARVSSGSTRKPGGRPE